MPKYGRGQHRAGDTAAPPCPPRVSSPPRARPAASIPAAPVPPVSHARTPPPPRLTHCAPPTRAHPVPVHPTRFPPPMSISTRRSGWRGAPRGVGGCETPTRGGFGLRGGGAPSPAPTAPPPHITPTHAAPTLQEWDFGGPHLSLQHGGPAGCGAAPRVPVSPTPWTPILWLCCSISNCTAAVGAPGGSRGHRVPPQ